MFLLYMVLYNYSLKENGFNKFLHEIGLKININLNSLSLDDMIYLLNKYNNTLSDEEQERLKIKILLLY